MPTRLVRLRGGPARADVPADLLDAARLEVERLPSGLELLFVGLELPLLELERRAAAFDLLGLDPDLLEAGP